MKKTLLIAAACLVTGLSQAQDNKFWLSGSAMVSTSNNDADVKFGQNSVMPSFGFMINPKMAVGIGVGFATTKQEEKDAFDNTEVTKTSEFYGMPFFRYYNSIGEKCSLYGEVNVGFGSGKSTYDDGIANTDDEEDTYVFMQAGISPGIQYWVHDNWSINAQWGALRYRSDNDKSDVDGQEDFKSSSFSLGLDLSSISFGLNFHF